MREVWHGRKSLALADAETSRTFNQMSDTGTNLINGRLESAWLHLRRFHGTRDELLSNQYIEVLDLSKPTSQIPAQDWPKYIDSLAAVAMIGRRNQWLDLKTNEQGFDVYWCLRKTALNGLKQN
jgi:hypothetical protein